MKTAEALFSEIVQAAQPAPVYPSGAADGVEDVVTHSAVPAKSLHVIVGNLERLAALELIFASQAIELREVTGLAPALAPVLYNVRQTVPLLTEDRPLSDDIERLAARVAAGDFADL